MLKFVPPLAADLAAYLDALPQIDLASRLAMDVDLGRLHEERTAARAGEGPPLARVADIGFDGRGGRIELRIYAARTARDQSCCLYLHGGGGVLGSIATHDASCRRLAADLKAVVVALGYRLAPEHPFPAALEDAADALTWLRSNSIRIGICADRIALAGDSIGAALALTLASELAPAERPCALSLAYGLFGIEPPFVAEGGGGMPIALLDWFMSKYLNLTLNRRCPRAFPLYAQLGDLPPTQMILAERDSLRPGNEEIAKRLAATDALADFIIWPGTAHGFLTAPGHVHATQAASRRIAAFLNHQFQNAAQDARREQLDHHEDDYETAI